MRHITRATVSVSEVAPETETRLCWLRNMAWLMAGARHEQKEHSTEEGQQLGHAYGWRQLGEALQWDILAVDPASAAVARLHIPLIAPLLRE